MTSLLPMPEIETERLLLRGWRASDAEPIMSIFKDAENSKYIGGVKPRWQAWRHFAMILGHWHLRGFTALQWKRKQVGTRLVMLVRGIRRNGRSRKSDMRFYQRRKARVMQQKLLLPVLNMPMTS